MERSSALDVRCWTFDVFRLETKLNEIIAAEIRRCGTLPFARFMELALYHPEHGYYSSGRANIGRVGDYFTNVSIGPLFGSLLAAQFIELWDRLGKPDDFTIIEQGAHDGQFAHDVLSALRNRSPAMFEAIQYRIIEPFAILRERQAETLRSFANQILWKTSLADLERFVGVHFSNELLDAMPVNLRGKSVGFDGDRFCFIETQDNSVPNQSQLDWIVDVAAQLDRGFVLAFDYGFVESEFHEVVQARSQHQLLDSPFDHLGQADVSVHINWTNVAHRAEQRGLRVAGFTDQHHFLTGIVSTWAEQPSNSRSSAKSNRELQTLLHPEMLGRAFQVLALAKNIDTSQPIAGFRFARDARAALELSS